MSLDHVLNYVTIFIIIIFCLFLTSFNSSAKYSVLKTMIRLIFFWDLYYAKWYWRNKIYILCNIFLIVSVIINLVLITAFSKDNIFQKPLISFITAPIFWLLLLGIFYITLTPKMKEDNK